MILTSSDKTWRIQRDLENSSEDTALLTVWPDINTILWPKILQNATLIFSLFLSLNVTNVSDRLVRSMFIDVENTKPLKVHLIQLSVNHCMLLTVHFQLHCFTSPKLSWELVDNLATSDVNKHGECCKMIWAATWQNQQSECAPSEVSAQPGHPPSLIRVFAVRSMGSQGPKLSSCGQRRLWSDWADAQADLSLRWAHTILLALSWRGSY